MKSERRWLLFSSINFLTGLVLGLSIGVLYAPQSGTRTRQKIRDMAEDAAERVEDWADDTQKTMSDLMKRGKETVERSINPT